jgi:beta-glucosidase
MLALKAAEKSIVLLKNDNNLLPLDSSPKKIVVTGPAAANAHTLFGNYYGVSSRFVTILEGLAEKVGDKFGINMDYRQGCLMYSENSKSLVHYGEANVSDVVIAVMGLDGAMEGEEGDAIASDSNGDRDTIELPPWQLKFLKAVRNAGKKIILVLTGGSPIAFPEDIADAVIFAWYSGEQGGKAVADIIFGDVVPSGKLPITFPVSTSQLPPYEDYSMKGRTYRYMTEKPLYPFGFGLSYTSFRFDSITLSAPSVSAGSPVKASVTVTNTGKMDADEVIQLYISRDERGENEPLSSLRGFRRVFIPVGRSKTVEFELSASAFETVNADGEYRLLPGSYTVIAADAAPVPVSVEKGAPAPVKIKIKINK